MLKKIKNVGEDSWDPWGGPCLACCEVKTTLARRRKEGKGKKERGEGVSQVQAHFQDTWESALGAKKSCEEKTPQEVTVPLMAALIALSLSLCASEWITYTTA